MYEILHTLEHSPTKTIYINYYTEKLTPPPHTHTDTDTDTDTDTHTHTHTHTHTDCSRNWVLILFGMKILREEEGSPLALKDDRVEQCLRSCGSEFQMWGPEREKVRKP